MRLNSGVIFMMFAIGNISLESSHAADSSPLGPSDPGVVSVKQYGAAGDGSRDDTGAISAAVASAPPAGATILNVYFPAGVYAIHRAITIPSNIRLFGDGETSVVYQMKPGVNVFQGGGNAASMASNISVEKLRFRGSGGFQQNYGLSLSSAQHVLFKDNSADTIPLVNITSPGTSDESRRSADFLIVGNHATGRLGEGAAILVSFAVDGVIRDNTIDTYDSGIQFWGGDARNPQWLGVKRLRIMSNSIKNVGAAAWGSAGQQIEITGNHVSECSDVCLDVEGSADVSISGNDVGNAANGGIAAFYASSHVEISSNTISQDSRHGSAIFIHGTGATQNTLIADNKLQVLGTAPAINTAQGALANSTIQRNEISTAVGAGVRILEGSGVNISSNDMRVGGPTGIAFEGGSASNILDNIITNTSSGLAADTSQGGIHIAWRSAAEPAQNNRIQGNTIVGFPISINDDCWGDHTSLNVISNNTLDTIYHRGAGASYHGTINDNHANSNPQLTVTAASY